MQATVRQTPTLRRHEQARLPTVGADASRREIGRGLSAVVFRQRAPDREAAIKVFCGHWSADAVHLLLSGAPNPYSWCDDAVQCALYRRRILAELVPFWFGARLSVAAARSVTFNRELRAWEMDTDFVAAFPAALHHPFTDPREGELRDLGEMQRELQGRLLEAGFVGLTWQAGLSNPVAANNFLSSDRRRGTRSRRPTWCWIDLESGVPALFPINPLRFLSHYGLWSWKLRRPLFDDVLSDQLEDYLAQHAEAIDAARGNGTTERLRQWAQTLAHHQQAWWSRTRLERGIECALVRGRIDATQAETYRRRPWLWLAREAGRGVRRGAHGIGTQLQRLGARLRQARPLRLARAASRFVVSIDHRRRVARAYALRRVRAWQRRGQLSRWEGAYLRCEAAQREHAAYLTDFVVHLAMKPAYKAVLWLGLPVLAHSGLISLTMVAIGLVFGGSIARTLYTGYRCAREIAANRRPPWLALVVGTAPVIGSAAFPLQLMTSSSGPDGRLAGFLIYDALGTLGRKVPIWGGQDTGTEHLFNLLGDWVVRSRAPLVGPARR